MSNLSFDRLKDVIKQYQQHNNDEDAAVICDALMNVLIACKYVLEKNTKYKAHLNSCIEVYLDLLNKINIDKFSSFVKFKCYVYRTVYWRLFGDFNNEYDTRMFEVHMEDIEKRVSCEDMYNKQNYGVFFHDNVKQHKYFHYYEKIAYLISKGYCVSNIITELGITKKKYKMLIAELKKL